MTRRRQIAAMLVLATAALACGFVMASSGPTRGGNNNRHAPSSLTTGKTRYVKCSNDAECALIRADLVCNGGQCKRDCPGFCESVALCKSDKQCLGLGPNYSCLSDGICSRTMDEEVHEGSKCTLEAHCFPDSTSLHCDAFTKRCLCNLPRVWDGIEKLCTEATPTGRGRFKRGAGGHLGRFQGLHNWEPLLAIGLFVVVMAIIALILKYCIGRRSDTEVVETNSAKRVKAKLAAVKSATNPSVILASLRAGLTQLPSATPTTMPEQKTPNNKAKAVLLSLRLPPFNRLDEESIPEETQDKKPVADDDPPKITTEKC